MYNALTNLRQNSHQSTVSAKSPEITINAAGAATARLTKIPVAAYASAAAAVLPPISKPAAAAFKLTDKVLPTTITAVATGVKIAATEKK